MLRKNVLLFLLVPVLALIAVGCGGDKETPEPAPVVQEEPAPVVVPMPAPPSDAVVYFKWSHSVLSDTEKGKLESPAAKIVECLNHIEQHPEGNQKYVVVVIGQTSTDGTDEANELVGSRRANNTAAALVELGVPAEKIRVKLRSQGMGKDSWRAVVKFVPASEARTMGVTKYTR